MTLISCKEKTETQTQQAIPEGWKQLDETGYGIQYPDNWDLDKSGQNGVSFYLFSKLISPQDKFRENVNLLIQDLKGQNIDLDKFTEISEEQIKTMITNSNLLESKRMSSKNGEFHKLIFTGDEGVYKLKFEQYYWVKDSKAYILTLTSEADQFDQYKETGEKILNNFVIK